MFRRWETATRYYTATVTVDLFGALVLVKQWGGLGNGRGGEATVLLVDQVAADSALSSLARRRIRHGYRLMLEH